MKQDVAGDITTEVCPKCGGVFLDKGELNILATGIKGDIELCSIDNDFHEDRFQQRSCPKCEAQQMTKVNLLRLSDLIFDYCWKCEGFFLDMGEIQAMNRELKSLTPNKSAEEYRATHSNHLVRIDQTTDVVDAQIRRNLKTGLRRLHPSFCVLQQRDATQYPRQEVWPMRLAKGLGGGRTSRQKMNNSMPYFESKDRMQRLSQDIWTTRLVNYYSSLPRGAGVFTA